MIDGQGNLNDEAINSTLILTDVVMIHFHRQDFDDQNQLNDLKNKIQMVQNAMNNCRKKIHVILVVRDANESLILKKSKLFDEIRPLLSLCIDSISYKKKT